MVRIKNLKPGAYDIVLTDTHNYGAILPQQLIEDAQTLDFKIPAKAVVTIYRPL